MTFWGGSGSGSADPCLWLMDPVSDPDSDPDPGSGSFYFRHWPSRCQQKTNFLTQFFSAYDFLKLHLHHFSKIKIQKESQNRRNQGFSDYFCMIIEGSGSRERSGSIHLTSGSGSGSWRPKNTWIRWIRIRIRIRIRNTGCSSVLDLEVFGPPGSGSVTQKVSCFVTNKKKMPSFTV